MKAENFLLAHEDEAKSIILRKWGFDPEFMRESLGQDQAERLSQPVADHFSRELRQVEDE